MKKLNKIQIVWQWILIYLRVKKRRIIINQGTFNTECVKDLYAVGIDEYNKDNSSNSKGII